MSKVCAAVKIFMGYNFHHVNAVLVRAMCQRAEIAGFAKDLHKLEEAEYLSVEKTFVGRKPQSRYSITDKGRTAFKKYIENLEKLING